MLRFVQIAVHNDARTVYAADMPEHATDTPPTRRVPVEEAAKVLGITANAVRKRVERGTLRSARDGDTRYVLLNADMPRPDTDMSNGMPADQALIVARLENEVGFLRDLVRSRDEELRREREAREEAERRHDTIIMRMAERIPELEAPRNGHETATAEPHREEDPRPASGGAQEAAERRSWLYRFFFGA
jgi:excisionase family DNA binding protein